MHNYKLRQKYVALSNPGAEKPTTTAAVLNPTTTVTGECCMTLLYDSVIVINITNLILRIIEYRIL